MKNRSAVVVVAALLASVALYAQTAPAVWKQYSYPSDGFAISSPVQPTLSSQVKPTDSGNVEMHTYTISLSDNGIVMISVSEVKGLENASAKERLQKAKEGALKAGNAALTTEKAIVLGSYPGLQYEAQTQTFHVRARMYIIKNRLLQLLEISPLSVTFPADAERITTSVRVISQ